MLVTIIIFLGLLSVLVLAHEWGHYFTAKRMGMDVEEFGLGFPPRLFSWKGRDGMRWSLNLIPLGGFVKIKGESGENRDDLDSFAHKSIPARLLVLVAGVVMNLVLAAVLLSVGFGIGVPASTEGELGAGAIVTEEALTVMQVLADSPAAQAGIEPGEKIVSVNGQAFASSESFRETLGSIPEGDPLTVEVGDAGGVETVTVETAFLEELEGPGLGLAVVETGIVRYPWYMAPVKGVEATAALTVQIVIAFADIIQSLFVGEEVPVDVAGPVGIAVLTGEVAALGFVYLLQFAAVLSINLAIINILPFPALDGGRVAFVALEAVRRKPASPRLEALVHNLGFIILILLIIVITYQDILRVL